MLRRSGYLVLGFLMLALGIIGAFLPVMPTTIFLILAAWFFGRSSPRLEAWLLNHRRFGPSLRAWRENGAIPRRAKLLACLGMTLGYVVFFITVQPRLWPALGVALFMLGSAWYVTTRPEPPTQADKTPRQ
ncbi:YbaN family protein [Corticibacterium sp. UT-5YL-CI-8]|nr:YbaN family protein [Tianweitania sp. UT-5YL-CI-8]